AELVVVDGDVGQRGAAGVGDGVGPGDRGAADHAGPVLECGGVDVPDAGPVTGLGHVPGLFVDADARHQFAVEEGAHDVGVARWDRQHEFTGVHADLIVRFGQARAREVLELPLGAGVCFGDGDLFALGDGSGAAVVTVGVEAELLVGPCGTVQAAVRTEGEGGGVPVCGLSSLDDCQVPHLHQPRVHAGAGGGCLPGPEHVLGVAGFFGGARVAVGRSEPFEDESVGRAIDLHGLIGDLAVKADPVGAAVAVEPAVLVFTVGAVIEPTRIVRCLPDLPGNGEGRPVDIGHPDAQVPVDV